ncbi:thioredoxin family protein [Halobaculum sp. MBLA0147]|uniref:thioredoxin family protein n=1 Tax=Halobaculum sp. MBLA0147 TaxID=3079934 RepID=UPI00352610BB
MTEPTTRPRRIDGARLADEIASHDTLLVQFYTEGCTLCASMEPVLDNVVRETGVDAVLVNPRDAAGLVERHRITSVPTLALFRDGEELARLADGFVAGDRLTSFLADNGFDGA